MGSQRKVHVDYYTYLGREGQAHTHTTLGLRLLASGKLDSIKRQRRRSKTATNPATQKSLEPHKEGATTAERGRCEGSGGISWPWSFAPSETEGARAPAHCICQAHLPSKANSIRVETPRHAHGGGGESAENVKQRQASAPKVSLPRPLGAAATFNGEREREREREEGWVTAGDQKRKCKYEGGLASVPCFWDDRRLRCWLLAWPEVFPGY
jgi:hypothetical protein